MKRSGLAAGFALAAAFVLGGDVVYVTDHGKVQHCPASDNAESAAAVTRIGGIMPDGTVYAGFSPDTGKPLYTTPADEPGPYSWYSGKDSCAASGEYGHKDWRAPTKGELNVLFRNSAAIGGFDTSGSYPAGWYWSSSQSSNFSAWGQRFSDGHQDYDGRDYASSLRCVRG